MYLTRALFEGRVESDVTESKAQPWTSKEMPNYGRLMKWAIKAQSDMRKRHRETKGALFNEFIRTSEHGHGYSDQYPIIYIIITFSTKKKKKWDPENYMYIEIIH